LDGAEDDAWHKSDPWVAFRSLSQTVAQFLSQARFVAAGKFAKLNSFAKKCDINDFNDLAFAKVACRNVAHNPRGPLTLDTVGLSMLMLLLRRCVPPSAS
jgi:hypothetical protein